MSQQHHNNPLTRAHARTSTIPIFWVGTGVVVLLAFVCATLTQIATSELLVMGTHPLAFRVSWNVINQPWQLLTGQSPIREATADLYGWIVEIITIVFALALSVAITKLNQITPGLGKFFGASGFLLIILNSWADYNSAPGATPLIQGLVAFSIGLIVVIGLPLGIGLIEHGLKEIF